MSNDSSSWAFNLTKLLELKNGSYINLICYLEIFLTKFIGRNYCVVSHTNFRQNNKFVLGSLRERNVSQTIRKD